MDIWKKYKEILYGLGLGLKVCWSSRWINNMFRVEQNVFGWKPFWWDDGTLQTSSPWIVGCQLKIAGTAADDARRNWGTMELCVLCVKVGQRCGETNIRPVHSQWNHGDISIWHQYIYIYIPWNPSKFLPVRFLPQHILILFMFLSLCTVLEKSPLQMYAVINYVDRSGWPSRFLTNCDLVLDSTSFSWIGP